MATVASHLVDSKRLVTKEIAKDHLVVVIPSFNESLNLPTLLAEWVNALEGLAISYEIWTYDDGSTDQTFELLAQLKNIYPKLFFKRTHNKGHGQTCLDAYREHSQRNEVDYIFQIDADGQCDPRFFEDFWKKRSKNFCLFGERISRADGTTRVIISMILRKMIYLATGIFINDSNVPYRLMPRELLKQAVLKGDEQTGMKSWPLLVNVFICLLFQKTSSLHWINIHFRARLAGNPSVKGWKYAKLGIRTFLELKPLFVN